MKHVGVQRVLESGFRFLVPVAGFLLLLALWWAGVALLTSDPNMAGFSDFGPFPAFRAFARNLMDGIAIQSALPSLHRVGLGLFWAIVLAVPMAVCVGRFGWLQALTHLPFQFLRMVSPLSWMPIAVLVFATWDGAIVFLIAAAAFWPVLFSTLNGIRKMEPLWFQVARNLGAKELHIILWIVLPAVSQDILTGIRLALGVAWIILVPAEYLGVTSGLGYAINDARDTLSYDQLVATVLLIGFLGFALDFICLVLIKRWRWVRDSEDKKQFLAFTA